MKSHSSDVDRQFQIHGTVVSAEKGRSILIECRGARQGEIFRLPPDTAVFGPGTKRIYRLRSTGEDVDSPDAVATWEIAAGEPAAEEFI